MEEKEPLVSILIPTYNRQELLERAIESAINQTYKNIEILIGDNYSEDDTEALCHEYEQKDNRIKYHRHTKNIKALPNSTSLLTKFKGEYFVWLCDDDWLDLNYVEEGIKFLQKHKTYTYASPRTVLYNDSGKKIRNCKAMKFNQDNPKFRILNFIKNLFLIDDVSGVFRRDVIDWMFAHEDAPFKYRYAEDVTFMLKFLTMGKGIIIKSSHYNKTEGGGTRELASRSNDIFDSSGITLDNIHEKISKIFVNNFIEDKIFVENLTEAQLDYIVKNTYKCILGNCKGLNKLIFDIKINLKENSLRLYKFLTHYFLFN